MTSFAQFEENLKALRARLEHACAACGRDSAAVKILPVTKNHPSSAAEYAFRAGLKAVGENRVQEAEKKIPLCGGDIEWELIGHLQTNKAHKAAALFARIQSVDSEKLIRKLNVAAENAGKVLRVLLQINAGRDPAKFGAEIEDAPRLLEEALKCPSLKVEGLMTIAPLDENLDAASRSFSTLRNIRDNLQRDFNIKLPELSMGMSADLEQAVAEGSTMIRVGTFLYGDREY